MDRRQVMQIATGAMSLVAFQANAAEKAATASAAVAGRTPEDVARDEDYWTEIRNAFTIDRNVINFNNGYASPAPIPVQDAMRRYLDLFRHGSDPDHGQCALSPDRAGARESGAGGGLRSRGNGDRAQRQRGQRDRADTASTSSPATRS